MSRRLRITALTVASLRSRVRGLWRQKGKNGGGRASTGRSERRMIPGPRGTREAEAVGGAVLLLVDGGPHRFGDGGGFVPDRPTKSMLFDELACGAIARESDWG